MLQILGVDQTPEGVSGHLPELLHVLALEQAQQAPVGVEDLLVPAGTVDEKAAGHLIHKSDGLPGQMLLLGLQGQLRLYGAGHKLLQIQAVAAEEVHHRQGVLDQAVLAVRLPHAFCPPKLLFIKSSLTQNNVFVIIYAPKNFFCTKKSASPLRRRREEAKPAAHGAASCGPSRRSRRNTLSSRAQPA